jgi:hypothetical protein
VGRPRNSLTTVSLDVTPPLGKQETEALHAALASAGVSVALRPAAYDSPWWRASAQEAVDGELAVDALGALAPQDARRNPGVVEP